jgi:putative SOS response-associated peptidase YedK
MCGRFALLAKKEEMARRFKLIESGPSQPSLYPAGPRFNIAPSQSVAVVRAADGTRFLDLLTWGLIPSWAADKKIGYKLINARSETVATKPSFRSAFKSRRCLIPASGFFEWKKVSTSRKQPYFIRPSDHDDLFAFAGLWEKWTSPHGEPLESCTILTTEANELMKSIHDRMPVILDSAGESVWLDLRSSSAALRVSVRALRQRADGSLRGQFMGIECTESGATVHRAGEGIASWQLLLPEHVCRPKAQASSSTVPSRLASAPSSRLLTKVYASGHRLSVNYCIPRLTALEKT